VGLGAVAMAALAAASLPWRPRVLYSLTSACSSEPAPADAGCPPSLAPAAGRYVSLGDSFAAGEGLPPFDEGTTEPPGRCHRSPLAYPRLLRWQPGNRQTSEHWACSRAALHDLTERTDEPAQLDRIAPERSPSATTALVTMTLGGNEIGFRDLVARCVHTGAWFGLGANRDFDPDCRDTLEAGTAARLRDLERDLPAPMARLRARAPHATVLIVGYPALVPITSTGACRGEITHTDGTAVGFGAGWEVSAENTAWVTGVLVELNRVLALAAGEAGFGYVDVAPVFAGHEACSADPWIRGVVVDGTRPSEYSFHPTSAGQLAMANEVAARIRASVAGS
jgi:lysophospholipase L1-like esterase